MAELLAVTYDFLRVTETVGQSPNYIAVAASDGLTFTENDRTTTNQLAAADLLGLDALQWAIASLSGDRGATETLRFTESAERVKVLWAFDVLQTVQLGEGGREHDAGDALVIVQSAAASVSRPAGDALTFAERAATAVTRAVSAREALTFFEWPVTYIDSTGFFWPGTPCPAARPHHTTTLSTPAGSMTLPSPEFGNTEELGQTRVQRQTLGGATVVFHESYWPTTDELSVTFRFLSPDQAARLRSLVSRSVGLLVSFADHEGFTWQAIVTTPECEVTDDFNDRNLSASLKLLAAK